MSRIRRLSCFSAILACGLVAISSSQTLARSSSNGRMSENSRPAAALSSIVPKLKRARIPVYLPSWLPGYRRRPYASASLVAKGLVYSVYLTTTRKPGPLGYILFWMIAEPEARNAHGPTVQVGNRLKGHINAHGALGFTVSWSVGQVGYTIGGPARGNLLRVARSIIRVH